MVLGINTRICIYITAFICIDIMKLLILYQLMRRIIHEFL